MKTMPIAIIGVSCRFPKAASIDAFDDLLFGGHDAIGEIPLERWARGLFFHPSEGQPGKTYTSAAGCLDSIDQFDPFFFGISSREASHIDPQQRLLLELAQEAMEDAGVPAASLAGQKIGVFVGGSSWDYATIAAGDLSGTDAYSMQGAALSSMSNRLSYQFDLHGPSLTIDTACSSSLVALHLACEALRRSEITGALVGGVNLLLAPHPFVGFARASMLSRLGRCHPFDARADGYVRAEGGGVVLLKPLVAAMADRDPIRAVILASGVNSDGRTNGFAVPNAHAQERLLREVHSRAGIAADDISYFEAHGTGTPVGDPLEATAIGRAIGQYRQAVLPIGSVKGNVGHLEAASGMAGLMKLVVSLARQEIPASLNFDKPNPHIPFASLKLEVVAARRRMIAGSAGFVAAVNSFGFGGTNAHVIVAAAPAPRAAPSARARKASPNLVIPPLLLSARAPEALRQLARSWQPMLANSAPEILVPLLRAATRSRDHHPYRLAVLGAPGATMAASLTAWLDAEPGSPVVTGHAVPGRLAFVFSGNGSQWPGMAGDAIDHSAPFRKMIDAVDAVLTPLLGWSVKARLRQKVSAADLRNTAIAQPMLFAVQLGCVVALRAQGVVADAHVGHSVGEVAAAWASGALDLAQASRVIVARSLAQQTCHGLGGMAVLGLGAKAARTALALVAPDLAIAAINSARSVTVAGSREDLAILQDHAAATGWTFLGLELDYAFHSSGMDRIRNAVVSKLAGLNPAIPATMLVSTVTGQPVTQPDMDANYWWRNVRQPVRFSDAVETMIDAGVQVFVEIGPLPVLQSYLREAVTGNARPGRVLATLGRLQAVADPFEAIAAQCYAAGSNLASAAVFNGPLTPRGLPHYPWQRERYWHERTADAHEIVAPPCDHPLLGYRLGATPAAWVSHPSTATDPWLCDHIVDGAVLMPATAMIEMALAAAQKLHPDAESLELRNLEISRPIPLETNPTREVTLRVSPDGKGFTIASRLRLSNDPQVAHAVGQLSNGTGTYTVFAAPSDNDDAQQISAPALYQAASSFRLNYGPAFQTVRHVRISAGAQAVVELDDRGVDRVAQGYAVDPTVLDGALQGLIGLAVAQGFCPERTTVLPWRFGRVRLLRTGGVHPVRARLHLRWRGARALLADIALIDSDDITVMELLECWFIAVPLGVSPDPAETMVCQVLVPSSTQPAGANACWLDHALAGVAVAQTTPDTVMLADAMLGLAAREVLEAQEALGGMLLAGGPNGVSGQLLGWLENDGLATKDDDSGRWSIAGSQNLPAWSDVWRGLLFDAPAAAADTALAGTMAGSLTAILAGGWEASPACPATLVDQMLFASPTGAGAIDALLAAVAAWLHRWPAGRALRIAQIGAGWPSLTRRLLEIVAQHVVAPENIGHRFVALAADEDALAAITDTLAGWPGVTGRVYDFLDEAEKFDLVLGVYPFAAPRAGAIRPASAAALLSPGGHLLVIEAVPNRIWQLVFGAEQSAARVAPDVQTEWQAALQAAGCARTGSALIAGGQLWQAALIGAWRGDEAVATTPAAKRPITVYATGGETVALALAGGMTGRPVQNFATLPGPCSLAGPPAELDVVIFLPSAPAMTHLPEQLSTLAASLTALGNRIGSGFDAGTRVWLITRDAGYGAPSGSAALGLVRTMANEMPQLECRLLRLDPVLSDELACRRIVAELAAPDAEREVIWTPAGRFVRRLRRGAPNAGPGATGATRLVVGRPGLLGSVRWEGFVPRPPGPGEVAITVEAAGLNFRDLMWAQGMLPEEALMNGLAGASLGIECAGVVSAVGPGVDDLMPGARVIAVASSSLASEVVALRRAVIAIPDDMDMAAAATIPVAFLTAVYALGRLANLAPGERVLIHGGLGSLGLAAVQYARHRGAIVYATAGSPLRRDLLRRLGIAGVFDSRSAQFADDVMAATDGEGVDVVMNSLSGELMQSGLRVLRPFGRFIEVGKRDLYGDTAMGLRPLRHNITYFAVDADELAAQRPDVATAIFSEITALFAQGQLRPLPYRRYDFNDAALAFRQLQGSGHIGKIVLTPRKAIGTPRPTAKSRPAFVVRHDRTYVLSGAIGGFGLEAAVFLAGHGARHIALLGRRGWDTPGAAAAVERLTALDVKARVFACDVADASDLAVALAEIRAGMPPIAGVLHAAMVLDDAWIEDLNADRFEAALRPKLGGAEALDQLTRADPVELFVLFSSITAIFGNPGQANYVAANAAMEAVAERRCAEGLPALAVAFGPIADAGYLTREARVSEALEKLLGRAHMSAAAALAALPALVESGVAVCGLADLHWGALARQLPALRTPLLEEMPLDGRAEASTGDLRRRLATLSPDEAAAIVLEVLVDEIALILQVHPNRIDPDLMITDLGMDSLTSVELRTALQMRLGFEIPISFLSSGATLRAMSGRIARMSDISAPEDDMVSRILQFESFDEPLDEPPDEPMNKAVT